MQEHIGIELANGTLIELPATSWCDQHLVRRIIKAAAGITIAPMTDAAWNRFLAALHVLADTNATAA